MSLLFPLGKPMDLCRVFLSVVKELYFLLESPIPGRVGGLFLG